jgi:nucleoside-diphosphate-sugar epimerase
MANYFITGGTGFVGTHLIQRILSGNDKLVCLRRQKNPKFSSIDAIRWIEGDLLESSTYKDVLKDTEYVFHLAGLLSARRREDYVRVNVDGTASLLKACREVGAPLKRFVHLSSIAAQGPSQDRNLLKETGPCSPQSEYGKSKHQAEQVVLDYLEFFPVVILRPTFVYGRGDLRGLKFLQSMNNPASLLWASYIKTICLCNVSDVVQSCLLSARKDIESGDIFNISDPAVSTWKSLWKTLEEIFRDLLGKDFPEGSNRLNSFFAATSGFDSIAQKSVRHQFWACDVSKAKNILGFSPEMSFRKGASDTIRWYMNQRLLSKIDIKKILEGNHQP